MEILSWFLVLITGFLFSFVWKEFQKKIYHSIPILDQLRRQGVIKFRVDPMEERLDDLEAKLNKVINKLDTLVEKSEELENIKKSLTRVENMVNQGLKYFEDIPEIKDDITNIKEKLDKQDNENEEDDEDNEYESEDEEERVNNLLLERKKRIEEEAKFDIVKHIKDNKLEDIFKEPRFFTQFQEEIRKRNIPQTQAVIELLAIQKLPVLDLKAPMTEEFCNLIEAHRKQFSSLSILGDITSMIDLLIPSVANITFAIILLATYQKDRIPEVFNMKEDFTIPQLYHKLSGL